MTGSISPEAGRRDGPLNELSVRRLACAEQLRSERQRSAGAEGGSEEVATADHEAFRFGFTGTAHCTGVGAS